MEFFKASVGSSAADNVRSPETVSSSLLVSQSRMASVRMLGSSLLSSSYAAVIFQERDLLIRETASSLLNPSKEMPLTVSKTGEVSDAWLAVAFAALSGSETEREWSTTVEMPKSTTTAPAAAKGIHPPLIGFLFGLS